MWGIYNTVQKEFQFPSIRAETAYDANEKLFKLIRYDAYKWRFVAKRFPKECPVCHTVFSPVQDSHTYCSKNCRNVVKRKKKVRY